MQNGKAIKGTLKDIFFFFGRMVPSGPVDPSSNLQKFKILKNMVKKA